MTLQRYLAIDLGAESGRGILADFDGERIALRELGRFATGRGQEGIGPDGVRRWDFERIWGEIAALYQRARADAGASLRGVGVDSWGVDFGLLDAQGQLLEPPVHYRNMANVAAMQSVQARIPPEEIWNATGIQFLPFNTLYQLAAVQQRQPELLDRAAHLLMIPDLIHHRLTGGGSLVVERTNASTTQFLDPRARAWDRDLLNRLGLPSQFLGALTDAGTQVGSTPEGVPVYAPGTHDTASAVAAVPAGPEARWAFLSSGTWSLLGTERAQPVLTAEARRMGLSNEGGVGGTIRLLKNIMGLWLVQECRRSLKRREGRDYDYAALTDLAAQSPSGGPLIDAADTRFLAPADMAEEIAAACQEAGQSPPQSPGALIRCCLESLALAYRQTLRDLESLLGARFDALHIVGGGSQNRVLNQWTADACGIPVLSGPGEATALGNVLGQLVGSSALADWTQARQVSRQSCAPEVFLPDPKAHSAWQDRHFG